jgi:hypothetical protein
VPGHGLLVVRLPGDAVMEHALRLASLGSAYSTYLQSERLCFGALLVGNAMASNWLVAAAKRTRRTADAAAMAIDVVERAETDRA